MKKLVLVFVAVITLLFSNTVFAQFIYRTEFKSVEEIDGVWNKTPFIKNTATKQINVCGVRLFTGKIKGINIRMCRIDTPNMSQIASVKIQKMQFNCPIELPNQILSEPKLIGQEIVFRASSKNDKSEAHFYLSYKDGDWFSSDIRSREWKTKR